MITTILSQNLASSLWPLHLWLQYFLELVHSPCDQQYLLIFVVNMINYWYWYWSGLSSMFLLLLLGTLWDLTYVIVKYHFAHIVALETGLTSCAGDGTFYWYVCFGGILSNDRDNRCCTFFNSWINLTAMYLAWWNSVL